MQEAFQDDEGQDKAEQLMVERERLASLSSDISTVLVQSHKLEETLQGCCKLIVSNLNAALASIWMVDREAKVLELRANCVIETYTENPDNRVAVGKFHIGFIARERKPYLTNHIADDDQVDDPEWIRGERLTSFAGFPLIVENRLLGVLAIFARTPFTQTTFQALSTVADGIALGIERQRAEEKLGEQTEVLETIYRMGQVLSAELDQQKLVQAVTDAATELTGAQFGSFFYNVYNDQGASYMLYTLSGVPRESFSHLPMPRATELFGPTFRGEGIIRINDVKYDPRYGKSSPYYGLPPGHLPVTSYLAVPVVSRSGEVLGGLFFGHSLAGVFTERHERIVGGLAAQVSVAIDNAQLYKSAQQSIKERESLLASEQEARKQAEIASRAKDEFLSLLSHELRTPLNAILGWSRMLTTGKLDSENFTRAIETIDRNAKLQARLIEDMLDVSRIISGKLRLDAHPVDLTTVINTAVDTSRPAADAKEIRIQVVMDFGTGYVLGDPVRLQQVVWNLLSNAIKFTPKHGRIQVQMERVNSHIEITVSDTGPGIDDEFLPYVFDRFRQGDSTSSKKHGGLGLGLAIVRHLVELHGGTVEAENRPNKQGAIFTVKLPVMVIRTPTGSLTSDMERIHPVVSQAMPFDCPPSLQSIKILAVDDEADARHLLTVVLEECGAEVRTSGSVAEALVVIEEYEPDVLVSDIGMPEEDGYVLIKKVRERESQTRRRIPAVALTAFARMEDRLRALSSGYNMHVPKPVEPAELVMVIASLVKNRNS